jgi:multidrug efflux pump subunit AcrB
VPLAYGLGSAADLKPLATAVIGALCFSVLLSLIATPIVFSLPVRSATPEAGRDTRLP